MRLFVLILTLIATPLWADACEDQFRAGLAAGRDVDGELAALQASLYTGLGWVTRRAVIARLEDRSPTTTACQEIDLLRARFLRLQQNAETAENRFRAAAALCWGINRTRAERNVTALRDNQRDIREQLTYLDSLNPRCD